MDAQLQACVRDSLDKYLFDNAKFMCERLYAEFPSEGNQYLLATCYMRANQAYRAYHLLSGAQSLISRGLHMQSRYLLAQCCFQLGKYDEAKSVLSHDSDANIPGGAAGYYLLGRLCCLTDNQQEAVRCYRSALMMDPLLWCAFEGLCNLGEGEQAAQLLHPAQLPPQYQAPAQQAAQASSQPPTPHQGAQGAAAAMSTPMQTPSTSAAAPASLGLPPLARGGGLGLGVALHRQETPGAWAMPATPMQAETSSFVTPVPSGVGMPAPAPVRRGGLAGPRETPAPTPMRGTMRMTPGTDYISNRWKFMDEGKLRKVSGRLFADPASAGRASPHVNTRRGSRGGSSNGASSSEGVAALASLHGPTHHTNGNGVAAGKPLDGPHAVLELLQLLGEGYRLLCSYYCQEAVEAFDKLNTAQYNTGWVLCQVGRACYEMVDFAEAARAFESAGQVDRCRLEGMELYSTVLWHLKKEVDLSNLAQEAVALDRLDPRSWCIMGNCFSLQKDHDAALKFFQRALQLDATFVYAYTLAGHEHLANEQFDKGATCYRNAMRLDPRHYNAWYGLGQIYFRQEKYQMAEFHFRHSLKINNRSSVLRCYTGMALAKENRPQEAVQMLQDAISADPRNPLARYELAAVLLSLDRLDNALVELEKLKNLAPREASVWFQMGKIYRRLEQADKALLHFQMALELKPASSDVNLIKTAIDKLRISNESDEEEI